MDPLSVLSGAIQLASSFLTALYGVQRARRSGQAWDLRSLESKVTLLEEHLIKIEDSLNQTSGERFRTPRTVEELSVNILGMREILTNLSNKIEDILGRLAPLRRSIQLNFEPSPTLVTAAVLCFALSCGWHIYTNRACLHQLGYSSAIILAMASTVAALLGASAEEIAFVVLPWCFNVLTLGFDAVRATACRSVSKLEEEDGYRMTPLNSLWLNGRAEAYLDEKRYNNLGD